MDEGNAPVTKQDLRDLKEDLRSEFGRSFDAMNWKLIAVGGVNVVGIMTGLAAIFQHRATAATASSALHLIGKAVGI